MMLASLSLSLSLSTQPMRIHVSEATAELLQDTNFEVEKRGRVEVKVNKMPLLSRVSDRLQLVMDSCL